MFTITEAEAAPIRQAFERDGEFAAAVELRRLFPAIFGLPQARDCARIIAPRVHVASDPVGLTKIAAHPSLPLTRRQRGCASSFIVQWGLYRRVRPFPCHRYIHGQPAPCTGADLGFVVLEIP